MVFEDPAVNWLLESDDPSIRYLTLREILNRPSDSKEVLAAKKQIPLALIVGENERQANVVTVRNLEKAEERVLSVEECVHEY